MELEIDWGALVQYLRDEGWRIDQHRDANILTQPRATWPEDIRILVSEAMQEGCTDLNLLHYDVILATKVMTCAAGGQHYFTLTVYSDGRTEIDTTIAIGDIEQLPTMLEDIESALEHEEE